MANVIKYSTTTPTNQSTLRRGNTVVAVGNAATSQFHSAGFKNGVDIPEGGYVVYTIGLNNNPKAFIAQDDNDLPAIARTLGGGNLTVLEAKVFLNAHTTTWILNSFPPNIVTDGLVYYSDARDMTSFMNNEPITNLVVYGTMLPSNPNATFISNSTTQTNVGGSQWTWSVYPSSNISPEGGMEWHPAIPDPIGDSGAWLMKKRPGGNSESNWSSTPPGAIDETKDYTISVWCKTDQASCFRIHINTTKDGSSFWGYGSAFHSGNGLWEKLSLTIPANNGNTSINTIRCQALYQYDADAYYKYFQVEEGSSATDFVNGTRSQNTLLNDLSGEGNTGTLTNGAGFNEAGYFDFDGVDDKVSVGNPTSLNFATDMSCEVVFKRSSNAVTNLRLLSKGGGGASTNQNGFSYFGSNTSIAFACTNNAVRNIQSTTITTDKWYHVVGIIDQTSNKQRVWLNGVLTNDATLSGTGTMVGNADFNIGMFGNSSLPWEGSIGDVKIYDKALSESEVKQNYYQAPIVTDGLVLALDAGNLVSYENGSTTTYSLTGSDSGTLTNGVGFSNIANGSWEFDDVDDYITVGNDVWSRYTYTDPFSLEVWINPDTISGFKHLIGKSYGNYRLAQSGNKISFRLDANNLTTNAGALVVGEWTHIIATWDPDTFTAKVYQDGVLAQSVTDTTVNWTDGSADFQLGNSPGENYYFGGLIAIGRAYSKTLTAAEVTQNYNAQSSRFQ